MKIFKKLLATLLLSSLIFSNASIGLGEITKEKGQVVYTKEEIKDEAKLYERAKNGITDKKEDKILFRGKVTKEKTDKKSNDELEVKTYVTTQKIKEIKNDDGTSETFYVTTAFNDFIIKDNTEEQINTLSVNNKKTNKNSFHALWNLRDIKDKTDSSISYRQVFTAYYSESGTYVKVDKYGGKWTRIDSQVTITKSEILAAVHGPMLDGGFVFQKTDLNTYNPPSNGIEYYNAFPIGFGYVQINDDTQYQAGRATMYLKRTTTGSTWFYDTKIIFGAIPPYWS